MKMKTKRGGSTLSTPETEDELGKPMRAAESIIKIKISGGEIHFQSNRHF